MAGAAAPESLKRLVELFDRERKIYQSPDYREEQLRAAADGRQHTARSLRLSDSEPLAVSRNPRADFLGQVYEQFLGKVIRLTAAHQAKVEEKPEVRKAGGVYYTPTGRPEAAWGVSAL